MTRPQPILWFERLLGIALLIDLSVNLMSWSAISARLAAQGVPPNPVLIGLIAAASPLLGLILLYFVARRRSQVARWATALLVVAGAIAFAVLIIDGSTVRWTVLFALTVVAEILKLAAVTRLFTAEASAWFADKSGAPHHSP
jgi:hypothetical protein